MNEVKCRCYNTIPGMGHDPICDCDCHQPPQEPEDMDKDIENMIKAFNIYDGHTNGKFCALCGFDPKKFQETIFQWKARWEKEAVEKFRKEHQPFLTLEEIIKRLKD